MTQTDQQRRMTSCYLRPERSRSTAAARWPGTASDPLIRIRGRRGCRRACGNPPTASNWPGKARDLDGRDTYDHLIQSPAAGPSLDRHGCNSSSFTSPGLPTVSSPTWSMSIPASRRCWRSKPTMWKLVGWPLHHASNANHIPDGTVPGWARSLPAPDSASRTAWFPTTTSPTVMPSIQPSSVH